MKIIRALGYAGVLLCTTLGIGAPFAKAADLTETGPSWTGAYVGASIGYGWDSGDVDLSNRSTDPLLDGFLQAANEAGLFPRSLSPDARGIVGGGQLGYNWQLSSDWVVGIEADLQASDIGDSDSETRAPGFEPTKTGAEKEVDWFGTLRARAGYLFDPQVLLYATGGLAYGKTSLNFNTVDVPSGCIPLATICGNETSSGVELGWVAGAGLEMMLAPNWSFKAEYLHVDLGSRSFDTEANVPIVFNASADFREEILHAGLNYHFD